LKTSSMKAKGRRLQQYVRDLILHKHPSLEEDDVKSTAMGQGGEDVQLSPAARKLVPLSIECKSRASWAFYKDLDQAHANCPKGCQPVLVAKANHRDPVVIINADYFFDHYQPRKVKPRR
jgi:hypothetical protein